MPLPRVWAFQKGINAKGHPETLNSKRLHSEGRAGLAGPSATESQSSSIAGNPRHGWTLAVIDHERHSHAVAARALSRLGGRWELHSYYCSADALLGLAHSKPEIILVDPSVTGSQQTQLLGRLRLALPQARILMILILAGQHDTPGMLASLRAGLTSFLAKPLTTDELLPALRSILSGAAVCSQGALGPLFQWIGNTGLDSAVALTSREQQLMTFLLASASDKDIAQALGISLPTVQRHLANIFRKLGAHNRHAAALVYVSAPKPPACRPYVN